MKKNGAIFIVLLIVFLLTSCTGENIIDTVYIDSELHVTESIEIDENHSTFQLKEVINLKSDYSIDQIEILVSEYAKFPYKSEIVENSSDLTSVFQDFFNQISETDHLGGQGTSLDVGLKAKVIISLSNNYSSITCEFFQNKESEIVEARVTYISKEIHETNYYTSEYQILFDRLTEYI